MSIEGIRSLLPPEAWATYIVGGIGAYFVIRQVRYNSILDKKNAVFIAMTEKIQSARKCFDKLESDRQSLVNELARIANQYKEPLSVPLSQDNYNKAIEEINSLYSARTEHLKSINNAYITILDIIRDIEKSTLLGKKDKQMARVLFYETTDHFNLINSVNNVLSTFDVIPPPGEKINVSPETFNKFIELLDLTFSRNNRLKGYLDDLEVSVHNTLVKRVFGKSKQSKLIDTHLSSDGIKDARHTRDII